jgi:hypothetical protein
MVRQLGTYRNFRPHRTVVRMLSAVCSSGPRITLTLYVGAGAPVGRPWFVSYLLALPMALGNSLNNRTAGNMAAR